MVAEYIGLDLLRVGHVEGAATAHQLADIADLAAGFRVERRAVQHHDAALPGADLVDRGAVHIERDDLTLATQVVVASEAGAGA